MKTILTIALLGITSFALAQNAPQPKADAMPPHHQQMQRIMQENDPAKRQALWAAHINAMRDGGCPMMTANSGQHGMQHGMMTPDK